MDHPYVILPEEQAPKGIEHCELCELSKQRNRVIWGEGNTKASLMMIMDNPGAREDREGNPYLCGTRETLQFGMKGGGDRCKRCLCHLFAKMPTDAGLQ